jgi:hypothetical protein
MRRAKPIGRSVDRTRNEAFLLSYGESSSAECHILNKRPTLTLCPESCNQAALRAAQRKLLARQLVRNPSSRRQNPPSAIERALRVERSPMAIADLRPIHVNNGCRLYTGEALKKAYILPCWPTFEISCGLRPRLCNPLQVHQGSDLIDLESLRFSLIVRQRTLQVA